MAYRRRQNLSRSSTFKEEFHPPPSPTLDNKDNNSDHKTSSSSFFSSPSLAAQAIKASAASRRNPSLSFAFNPSPEHHRSKSFDAYGGKGDSKNGFWGVLAQKAKSMLDDDNNNNLQPKHDIIPEPHKSRSFNTFTDSSSAPQTKPSYQYFESSNGKLDNPKIRKGLDKITSSLNQLGDTFEKAFEEGKTIVENKTADLRTQIMRKGSNGAEESNQSSDLKNPWQQQGQTQNVTNRDTQLKASRDVAMATAAKAKLLLRELKTVKADLAFAKARCAQLEEENKMLRDREGTDNKGHNRDDDDLIRHQLETLLAEKARLASENEIYARENRFLREIVEYHQLTMQDVVYLDEGMEEVTEVYPVTMDENGVPRMLSMSPHSSSSLSPTSQDEVLLQSPNMMMRKEMFSVPEEDCKSNTSEDDGLLPSHTTVSTKHAK